ncbi:MAG: sugar phosphate isomerase/epimerase family protein [Bacteroidales bacterium]
MRNKVLLFILVIGCLFGILSAFKKSPKKEIGLQLYSIREDIKTDLFSALDSVAHAGYTFVEAANYDNGKFYGMEPIEFKEALEKRGLRFLSSHIGRDVPDSANYAGTMAWWDQAIAAHQAAGVPYIVQPWMGKVGYGSLEGLKRYCNYFNEVGEKCNRAGIRFGYHNHSKEFEVLEGETIYDFMLANTDPEKVFFQIDVYWATKGGVDPAAYMVSYPGRFDLWHVKDEKEIGASGTIDFESIYKKASESGMKYAVIEQEAFTDGSFRGIRQSRDFVQNAPYIECSYSK